MSRVAVVVPVEGPLRVEQVPDGDVNVEAILKAEAPDGRTVDFGVRDGDEEIGRVAFSIIEGPAAINMRARYILVLFTGVHMVITGTAVFFNLTDDRVAQIVKDYP